MGGKNRRGRVVVQYQLMADSIMGTFLLEEYGTNYGIGGVCILPHRAGRKHCFSPLWPVHSILWVPGPLSLGPIMTTVYFGMTWSLNRPRPLLFIFRNKVQHRRTTAHPMCVHVQKLYDLGGGLARLRHMRVRSKCQLRPCTANSPSGS